MLGEAFGQAVEGCFGGSAVKVAEYATPVLHKPGVEGLHVFLDGCRHDSADDDIEAEQISVQALKAVLEEKGWPLDMSFTWTDMESLLQALAEASAEAAAGDSLCRLMDEIQTRAALSEFPLVCPAEVSGVGEQEAAAQTLSLVEKTDAVKIQSYIEYQKQHIAFLWGQIHCLPQT